MVEFREGSRGKKKLQIYIHVTQIKSNPEVVRLIAHIKTRLVKEGESAEMFGLTSSDCNSLQLRLAPVRPWSWY